MKFALILLLVGVIGSIWIEVMASLSLYMYWRCYGMDILPLSLSLSTSGFSLSVSLSLSTPLSLDSFPLPRVSLSLSLSLWQTSSFSLFCGCALRQQGAIGAYLSRNANSS